MLQRQSLQKGFTLIELMIVVAIIGILASVAVPAYQDYTQRSKLSAAVAAMSSLKTFVADCYVKRGTFAPCVNGAFGIPAAVAAGQVNQVTSATVTAGGVITVTSQGVDRAGQDMVIRMTPTLVGGTIQWAMVGTGCLDTDGDNAEDNPRGIDCGTELTG